MIKVTLYDLYAGKVLEIVDELKSMGLVLDKDFSFAYNKPKWDGFTGDTMDRHTDFTFYHDDLATWFSLKYGTNNEI